MASPTALRYWQLAVEDTVGTEVNTTRRVYGNGEASKEIAFFSDSGDRGSFDMRFSHDAQHIEAGGSFNSPLYVDQIVEWLLAGLRGGVTPTGPSDSAYTWKFTASNTIPDTLTLEYDDGYQDWTLPRTMVNSINISGSVSGECTVAVEFLSEDRIAKAATTGISDTTPSAIQGWESKLFIDADQGTMGSTEKAATLMEWEWVLNNNLTRHYSGGNKQTLDSIIMGRREVSFRGLFEFNSLSKAEYDNFISPVTRYVEIELGGNKAIGSSSKEKISLRTPLTFVAAAIGESDNVVTMEFQGENLYSSDLTYSTEVEVINSRSAEA